MYDKIYVFWAVIHMLHMKEEIMAQETKGFW